MSLPRLFLIAGALLIAGLAATRRRRPTQSPQTGTWTRLDDNTLILPLQELQGDETVVRVKGPYHEVMAALGAPTGNDRPPLDPGVHLDSLPEYRFGCPHCGKMSMYGESLWFYDRVGACDHTTTYVARCRKCQGLMRATIDHDD